MSSMALFKSFGLHFHLRPFWGLKLGLLECPASMLKFLLESFHRNKGKYVEDDNEIELSFAAHNESYDAEDQGTVTSSHSTSISVKDLLSYLRNCNKEFFIQQFKSVRDPSIVTQEAALMESNKSKNRYKNISPYNHSRVLLNIDADSNEYDYINASYIKNFKGQVSFIASQGPNKAMLDDFIRMLWEQKTNKLVMLTSVIETGKLKCEQYWPDKGTAKFGKIKMKLISEERFAEYSIRKLELSKKDEQSHIVTQYHYQAWPDQNVPLSPWGLVDFYHLVSSSQSEKLIVVHCRKQLHNASWAIALSTYGLLHLNTRGTT
ncbi:hypothetical protein Btru_026725 [Bulinus truncatus]|nr:hypothetical protein Btru_026725 [Bulinus truncatus]